MSDFAFTGLDDFEFSEIGKNKKNSPLKMPLIKVFIAVFLILLVCEFLVYVFVLPCMNTVEISFSGMKNFTAQSLMKAIEPCSERNFLNFHSSEAKSLLMTIPSIEDVEISKRFPNKVYINVIERTPIAKTIISDGKRSYTVQIDKNGFLFTGVSNLYNSDKTIPLISGIPVENIPEGMKIPSKYRALMDQIVDVRGLSQNYLVAFSEIHVVPKEYGNYELVLYPNQSHIRILTGRQLNEESLVYGLAALKAVTEMDLDVEEIDIRYGSISFRGREVSASE